MWQAGKYVLNARTGVRYLLLVHYRTEPNGHQLWECQKVDARMDVISLRGIKWFTPSEYEQL